MWYLDSHLGIDRGGDAAASACSDYSKPSYLQSVLANVSEELGDITDRQETGDTMVLGNSLQRHVCLQSKRALIERLVGLSLGRYDGAKLSRSRM
jgi:hypothetical protein